MLFCSSSLADTRKLIRSFYDYSSLTPSSVCFSFCLCFLCCCCCCCCCFCFLFFCVCFIFGGGVSFFCFVFFVFVLLLVVVVSVFCRHIKLTCSQWSAEFVHRLKPLIPLQNFCLSPLASFFLFLFLLSFCCCVSV